MRDCFSLVCVYLLALILSLTLGACSGGQAHFPPADNDEALLDSDLNSDQDSDASDQTDDDPWTPPDGDDEQQPPDGDNDFTWPDGDAEMEAEDCTPPHFTLTTAKPAVGQAISFDAAQPGLDPETLLLHYILLDAPPLARNVKLVCASCDLRFGENMAQSGLWTNSTQTRFYAPVAGTYRLALDLRGADGSDLGFCRSEIAVSLGYADDLVVELVEEPQDYPQSNVDLLLLRERPNATFAVPAASADIYHPAPVPMPSCTSSAECYGGLFPCDPDKHVCLNECPSDSACQGLGPGFICQTGRCEPLPYLTCANDGGCGLGLTCTSLLFDQKAQNLCTLHDAAAQSDTCFPANPHPVWGGYESTYTRCQQTQDCFAQDPLRLSLCNADPQTADTCAIPRAEEQPQATSGGSRFPEVQRISLKQAASGRLRAVVHQRLRNNGNPSQVWMMVYAKGLPLLNTPLVYTFSALGDVVWKALDINPGSAASARALCAGPTDVPCLADQDCRSGLGNSAFRCENRRCLCLGSNAFADFARDPYANPFVLDGTSESLPFVPTGATPRSIFCDLPSDQPAPEGPTCAALYGR